MRAANPTVEETTEEYYPVKPGATIAVRNRDGSIQIYGAETNELKVQATKKAFSAERLKQIAVNVSEQADSIMIETSLPPKGKHWLDLDRSGTVDYIIVVPQTCQISNLELRDGEIVVEGMRGPGVKASLVNGRIVGHNCFGDLQLSVVNGGLDLFFDWWEKRAMMVSLRAANGGVRAMMPSDAAFSISAETASGHIDDAFLPKDQKQRSGPKVLRDVVGSDPASSFTIRTTSGNIRIEETY